MHVADVKVIIVTDGTIAYFEATIDLNSGKPDYTACWVWLEVRERKLYRKQYGSFNKYVRKRWGMSPSHAEVLVRRAHLR